MDHPEQLADLLVGTVLAGRRVLTFDRPDGAVRFLAVEIAEDELVPSWRAGHRLLEQTGRWPVVGNPYPQARRNDVATALAADDAFSNIHDGAPLRGWARPAGSDAPVASRGLG